MVVLVLATVGVRLGLALRKKEAANEGQSVGQQADRNLPFEALRVGAARAVFVGRAVEGCRSSQGGWFPSVSGLPHRHGNRCGGVNKVRFEPGW